MPRIDVKCVNGHVREVYRSLAEWPNTPPCPACEAPTEQIHLPSYMKGHSVDPVVVYQAPDGSFRFPPDTTTSSTAMYDGQGFTRIELRGWTDVRRFEKHFNDAQMSEVRRRVERQQEAFERAESERRSEIRRCLEQGFAIPEVDDRGVHTGRMRRVELTAFGRKVLEAAMERNDRKGGPRTHDVGFRVEAYSENASNREAYSDGRGRRQR